MIELKNLSEEDRAELKACLAQAAILKAKLWDEFDAIEDLLQMDHASPGQTLKSDNSFINSLAYELDPEGEEPIFTSDDIYDQDLEFFYKSLTRN